MSKKHFLTVPLTIADADVCLEVEYTFLKGAPEQGPSYSSGGQPADPDEIEIIEIRHGEEVVPKWLSRALCEGDEVLNYLHENHDADDDGPDPDAYYDRMRDERMERGE